MKNSEKTPLLIAEEGNMKNSEKMPLLIAEEGNAKKSEEKALSNEGGTGASREIADRSTLIQRLLSQTFASTAHLANLLPTGTLLAFQILCPIFSNNGQCDYVSRLMTEGLLFLCGLSCFLVSFTDSFVGSDGKLYYGIATPKGLLAFNYVRNDAIPEAARYRVRFVDFVHAFLSVMVFAAVALLDQNVLGCLYPAPEGQTAEVLQVLPVGIGVISSLLFVAFPTTRHGIGYPVTS